jgi:excisionase family DNA binding protein
MRQMSERAIVVEQAAAWANAGRFYVQRCRARGIAVPAGFVDQLRLYDLWSRSVADDQLDVAPLAGCEGRCMAVLLTTEDVADELQQGLTTVKRLIRDGELIAVKIGRTTRIRRADLDAYVAGLGGRQQIVCK